MIGRIVEVTNRKRNWGKFMVMRFDTEWERRSALSPSSTQPLLGVCGWTPAHLWVLDLQTGEGVYVKPGGCAAADLNKHRVWVCPMFEPFLNWLYAQDLTNLEKLPEGLDFPDAEFAIWGFRRTGKGEVVV